MEFDRIPGDTVTRFILSGSMETGRFERFRFEAKDAVIPQSPHLMLDVSGVDFIDSCGSGTMIELFKHTKLHGGELIIAGMQEHLVKLFQMLKLDTFFTMVPDLSAGEALLAKIRRRDQGVS